MHMSTKDKARAKTDGLSRKMASRKSKSKPASTRSESKYNILLMTDRLHQRA